MHTLTLTPLQYLISALLTGLLVHFLSLHFINVQSNEQVIILAVDDSNAKMGISINSSSIPIESSLTEQLNLSKELPLSLQGPFFCLKKESSANIDPESNSKTLDNLLDAIFVSHGIEIQKNETLQNPIDTTTPEPNLNNENLNSPILLNDSNFDSVLNGNWLILVHVPWDPFTHASKNANYLNYFTTEFNELVTSISSSNINSNLNLATLNAHDYPHLAANLQIHQYPSLQLVTDSGRLREWPFPLIIQNDKKHRQNQIQMQAIMQFIVHSQWHHLPFYHQLQNFNHLSLRPLTTGILGGTSILCLLITSLSG